MQAPFLQGAAGFSVPGTPAFVSPPSRTRTREAETLLRFSPRQRRASHDLQRHPSQPPASAPRKSWRPLQPGAAAAISTRALPPALHARPSTPRVLAAPAPACAPPPHGLQGPSHLNPSLQSWARGREGVPAPRREGVPAPRRAEPRPGKDSRA